MVSGQPVLEAGMKGDRQLLRGKGTQNESFWVECRGFWQRQRGQWWGGAQSSDSPGAGRREAEMPEQSFREGPRKEGHRPPGTASSWLGMVGRQGRATGRQGLGQHESGFTEDSCPYNLECPTPGLPRPVCRCLGSFQHNPSAVKGGGWLERWENKA